MPLKVERGSRVFPVSDSAFDITNALEREMKRCRVRWVRDRALSVETEDGAVRAVTGEKGTYPAGKVILATGGMSYPGTGSTGDGYRIAAALGHTVVEPHASLVPLCCAGTDCPDMQGLSLRNVELTVLNGKGKPVFREFGEMLFTHFGVSGPMILSASSHMRQMERGRYKIVIDLKPALSEQQLDARVLRDFSENNNRNFINALNFLLPKKLVPVIVSLSGIPMDTKVNSVTREQRAKLVYLLKHFTVTITDFRPIEEAVVTSGGVKISEIDPKTMQSKLIDGLYFAGEVIDVDAYTGGFNLQIAFSTGHLAGESAVQ